MLIILPPQSDKEKAEIILKYKIFLKAVAVVTKAKGMTSIGKFRRCLVLYVGLIISLYLC